MTRKGLYNKFAVYYDKIYEKLDHKKEAQFIKWVALTHKASPGIELLDVACGTGRHADLLKDDFKILGVDISKDMLLIAREKVPDVEFISGDMKKLDLGRKFDVLTCMFSAMNYNTTLEEFEVTLNNFYNHLNPGGVIIFDFGLNKENWIEGLVSVDTVVDENFKLARICQSHLENGIFNSNFIFLVKENGKFDFDIDEHTLGVFGLEDIIDLMEKTGFKTFIYDNFNDEVYQIGTGERPVFVGVK